MVEMNGLGEEGRIADVLSRYGNFALARYTPGGSLDTSFDGDGKAITDTGGTETAWALAIQPDGKIVAAGERTVNSFVGDFVLVRYHDAVRLYVQQDANFNVTAVTDSAGTVLERYIYEPYGSFTVLDADWAIDADGLSDNGQTHLHQGGRYDAVSGTYHFRNRDFSPSLGRWVQQDPMGYVDGMSLYEYVRSGPVTAVDPHGLSTLPANTQPTASAIVANALATLKAEHSQYLYYRAFALDAIMNRVIAEAGSTMASLATLSQGAQYNSITNSITLNGSDLQRNSSGIWRWDSDSVILHEMVHRVDDIEDFYLSGERIHFRSTLRRAEGIAYATETLFERIVGFRRMEDATDPKDAVRRWQAAWEKLGEYVEAPVWVGGEEKPSSRVTSHDMLSAHVLFGIGPDAFPIKILYEEFYKERGWEVCLPLPFLKRIPAIAEVWYR